MYNAKRMGKKKYKVKIWYAPIDLRVKFHFRPILHKKNTTRSQTRRTATIQSALESTDSDASISCLSMQIRDVGADKMHLELISWNIFGLKLKIPTKLIHAKMSAIGWLWKSRDRLQELGFQSLSHQWMCKDQYLLTHFHSTACDAPESPWYFISEYFTKIEILTSNRPAILFKRKKHLIFNLLPL